MQLARIRTRNKPGPDPGNATVIPLPDGAAGVRVTLNVMADLIRRYRRNPGIRAQAAAIVQPLAQKNWSGEIAALHKFVRDNIRYVRDIRGTELVQSPDRTLSHAHGDCDDKVVLLGSMLESIGHPVQLVAIGREPGKYSHVYLRTRIGSRWIALETTEPVKAGWEPARVGPPIIVTV